MVPPILTEKCPGRVRGKGRACTSREEGVRECWVSLGRYLARYGRDIEKGLDARFKASSTKTEAARLIG